ncbi:MAG TPA: hypothetical protein VK489_14405 [Ferruginibacter sp.]|nr:hypothetical protein [Ferruginibacter sp.]
MRKIMLYSGVDLVKEFKITEFYKVDIGIGGSSFKFSFIDTSGTSIFNKKLYIHVPISVKKNYFINRRSNAFIEFGIMNSFLGYDKKEFYYIGGIKTLVTKSWGYNAGLLWAVGFRTVMANGGRFFTIKLGGHEDYLSSYKNASLKIKQNTMVLGICFEKKHK